MTDIVGFARANNIKLGPRCASAVAWFKRYPENADGVIG